MASGSLPSCMWTAHGMMPHNARKPPPIKARPWAPEGLPRSTWWLHLPLTNFRLQQARRDRSALAFPVVSSFSASSSRVAGIPSLCCSREAIQASRASGDEGAAAVFRNPTTRPRANVKAGVMAGPGALVGLVGLPTVPFRASLLFVCYRGKEAPPVGPRVGGCAVTACRINNRRAMLLGHPSREPLLPLPSREQGPTHYYLPLRAFKPQSSPLLQVVAERGPPGPSPKRLTSPRQWIWNGTMRFASRRSRVSRVSGPPCKGHGQRASFCYLRHTHAKARKRSPGQAIQMTGPPADDETDAGTTRSARSACLRCDTRPGSVPPSLTVVPSPLIGPPVQRSSLPQNQSAASSTVLPRCVSGHAGQVGRGVADASSSAPSQPLS